MYPDEPYEEFDEVDPVPEKDLEVDCVKAFLGTFDPRPIDMVNVLMAELDSTVDDHEDDIGLWRKRCLVAAVSFIREHGNVK